MTIHVRGFRVDSPRDGLIEKLVYFVEVASTGSKPERHVRRYGGSREFGGTPVFNLDVLEVMRKHPRQGPGCRCSTPTP
jgi:hypothetical protein